MLDTVLTVKPKVTIEATKDGIKFSCAGDIGNGAVTLRNYQNVEKENLNVDIELTEPVSLTFSLKYLVNFCKAQPLSDRVKICLSNEVPLLVEYLVTGTSYLRFYLAPKVRAICPRLTCYVLTQYDRSEMRSKKVFSMTEQKCNDDLDDDTKTLM